MRLKDVIEEAVRKALDEMPARFRTKHLSNHKAMVDAHRDFFDHHTDYNTRVGSYLSKCDSSLGIRCLDRCNNAVWGKSGQEEADRGFRASAEAPVAAPSQQGIVDLIDIGLQYPGDAPFAARMRFHQSWHRCTVLHVPCGTGPDEKSTASYGNMLRKADADRGLNFTSPEAFSAAKRRVAECSGAVEPFRLFHNMLSSMPMCFNVFGPLVEDIDLATVAFRSLLGNDEIKRVRETVLEYAPSPKSDYLNDRTAFDAFVSYERPDGSLGFLGIETKLTEPFSQKHYDGPAYRRWVERPESPWPREAWSRLDHIEHNQLWRGHLLVLAMKNHSRSPYTAGRYALVRHPGDVECARVVEHYKALLKPQDQSFVDLPLDRIIGKWEQALPSACADWLAKFRLRYLDLGASEAEWQLRRSSR